MATTTEEAISQREKLDNQYDRTVRQEIETFRTKALAFLAGEITEADFRPFRLKHGIYGQRQPGVQMVRCKIPGGLRPISVVTRVLSNTVFHVKYGKKTFISAAPCPTGPLRLASMLTMEPNDPSRIGKNSCPRRFCSAASAFVNS